MAARTARILRRKRQTAGGSSPPFPRPLAISFPPIHRQSAFPPFAAAFALRSTHSPPPRFSRLAATHPARAPLSRGHASHGSPQVFPSLSFRSFASFQVAAFFEWLCRGPPPYLQPLSHFPGPWIASRGSSVGGDRQTSKRRHPLTPLPGPQWWKTRRVTDGSARSPSGKSPTASGRFRTRTAFAAASGKEWGWSSPRHLRQAHPSILRQAHPSMDFACLRVGVLVDDAPPHAPPRASSRDVETCRSRGTCIAVRVGLGASSSQGGDPRRPAMCSIGGRRCALSRAPRMRLLLACKSSRPRGF